MNSNTQKFSTFYEIEEAARYYYGKQLDKARAKWATFCLASCAMFTILLLIIK